MPDYTRSLVVQDGVMVENGAGLFSGFDDPTFDCPIGSLYLKTNGTKWLKNLNGTGLDKWLIETPSSNTNNGMGARKVPSGQTYQIDPDYESFVTRRMFCYGRLVLKGRLTVWE